MSRFQPRPVLSEDASESGQLRLQLTKLGLHSIAAYFEGEAEHAAKSESTYTAYLARLVEAELAEDVTLLRGEAITCHLRFKGGASRSLTLPAPLSIAQLRKTDPGVIQAVDDLLNDHTDAETPSSSPSVGSTRARAMPLPDRASPASATPISSRTGAAACARAVSSPSQRWPRSWGSAPPPSNNGALTAS